CRYHVSFTCKFVTAAQSLQARERLGYEMDNILKEEFYEEFCCTADQCSFTCCKGWEIMVDSDTYQKWESNAEQSEHICRHIKTKEDGPQTKKVINMGESMCCPFLNEKELCNLFIKFGEEAMPKTCKVFPRQETSFGLLKEYSLSCACPTVIDMIHRLKGKIKFTLEGNADTGDTDLLGFQIREAMIAILQNNKFVLKDKILLVFNMLLRLRKEPVITKEIMEKYRDEDYLTSLVEFCTKTVIKSKDSYQEITELFIDIVLNYSHEKTFNPYLKDISNLAKSRNITEFATRWELFKTEFGQNDLLLENCIVSKVFGNCISDDMEEMIMSFQTIITEYVMTKYSSFLRVVIQESNSNKGQSMGETIGTANQSRDVNANAENQLSNLTANNVNRLNNVTGNCSSQGIKENLINYKDIRDFIVIYSRIIGYNTEGMKEFWKECFDEPIWGLDYILLLMK
ncbi:MAG: flagellin lysine-N-methylase, partial [Mobilitalea sp.]